MQNIGNIRTNQFSMINPVISKRPQDHDCNSQNLWQTFFLFFFMWFAHVMEFPWIGSVFLLLHSLVLLMKQHSYGFYNGYLWGIKRETVAAKALLTKLASEGAPEGSIARIAIGYRLFSATTSIKNMTPKVAAAFSNT